MASVVILMAKDSFFLNFGGPGGRWITDDPEQTARLIDHCTSYYGGSRFSLQSSCIVNGIHVTLYAFAVHRAVYLELPENTDDDNVALFYKAKQIAVHLCDNEYKLMENNCVTAAASLLHMLDPSLTPHQLISPWTLDKLFKNYIIQSYAKKPETLKIFFSKYQQKVKSEFTLFSTPPHWTLHEIQSLHELIQKSHDKNFEERTKKVLFELGWVIGINANNQFIVGTAAPSDFREGLNKFYLQCQERSQEQEAHKQTEPSFKKINKMH